ncbi:predicted TIM-barrel fold metal-dependent hydrolase [Jatrophihabitans sp. GAS493]|uniref:amidohydrolase family protein n=1 Tax=Jatrophihabitans sp. GAS493 TaxID=1907575 RepID=UPI000BB9999F|nr:amidohydrolase family protein [Jatrophihabitans sp. GAS493]SOD71785.1 predicted TIM-barrel fold metal-dependent hydrolase [Jatrophihabitans sp. GAS493]
MTVMETSPAEVDTLKDVRIIDCDAHFTEPAELWTSRAPEHLINRMPILRTVDGITAWYIEGELWASIGGNTIQTDKDGNAHKVHGTHVVQPYELIDKSAFAVKERLELLDSIGVYAQILYPNGIGFASNHIFAIEDLELRTAVLQIYNDFLIDVQTESNGRLFPQGLLPVWDMDLTVGEIKRLSARGMKGFTMSDKPEMIGLPELWEDYWTPMWQLLNDNHLVANFHIGAGSRKEEIEAIRNSRNQPRSTQRLSGSAVSPTWSQFGHQRRLAAFSTQMYMSNLRIIVNLCMSDLFDRFPNLKIVSAESGIGWIPFMLEALEFQFDEMVTEEDEVNMTRKRPSEYFRDHIYVMFWFEKSGPEKLIETIGVNNVLVETDIPHPTCLYPNPKEHFIRVLADLPVDVKKRVLQDNAVELYNIELPQ